jgi:hypothetical protein
MKPPVFILGCPRSGTTLLYHMLQSAGGFAAYRKETHLYDMVVPRFGDLKTAASRQEFLNEWLNSYFGKLPDLDVAPLLRDAVDRSRSGGRFLRLLMESIARAQGAERWMEATPAHVLYIHEIKRDFPDALIVHVIRDGRDSALSLDRQHWIVPFPWDRQRTLAVAALYWEWMVRSGRRAGRALPGDYLEIRFEDLIAAPRETLREVGAFIDHELDYDRIQRNAKGTLANPNTSFREKLTHGDFHPVGRWKTGCAPEAIQLCESAVGRLLEELGYRLEYARQRPRLRAWTMRSLYLPYFSVKRWLKSHTPLGRRMVDTSLWASRPAPARAPS